MSDAHDGRHDAARPPDHHDPAAALPLGSREGLAPVAVTAEHEAVALAADDLRAVVRRLAFPAVASNLLMTLFASVDTYWVGTAIGATGLAAVSTSIFWVWMLVAIAEMIGVGLTAVAARRHGERRPGEAARVVGDSVLLAVALGALVAGAGLLSLDALFAVMRTPPDVSALGRAYLGTYLLGAPLLYGFFAVDAGFRAAGDTRTPLALLSVSVAITLVLDPVLILGLGGAPELGIAGAAVATVSTRALAFVAGVALLRRRRLVEFARPRLAPLLAVCRVGLPTALTGGFFSVIYVLLTRTTTQFGTPALAALGLGHRVESWLYMLAVGFGTATAAVVGQNLGAGQVERARRAAWVGVGYAVVPAAAMALLMLLVPAQLADLFTDDPAVVAEMKGVLLSLAPHAQVVDAAHDLAPHDVELARLALARYWRRFPAGSVHLAVVDPGVGSARRALAVESDDRFLVGPDNGVLSPALLLPGAQVVQLPVPHAAAPTFHGRDVFAPAAARLASGDPLHTLGVACDDPVVRRTPEARRTEDGAVQGEVIAVDRFGNLITNVIARRAGRVEIGGVEVELRRTYADVRPGALVALTGSSGLVEVAVRDGSAAVRLGAGRGSTVLLRQG